MADHRRSKYMMVLENHKRKLGDYEQVHFRRKSIVDRNRVRVASSSSSNSTSAAEIVLPTKRPSRPQLVPFNKNNAALFLRQTENLWLFPNFTRQDASKTLFDRPTGSFIVRNSQKARYALTIRLSTQDPAVSHFLLQTNQQGFLTIQGSNLPFLSIYDLLAFFCFKQSGGMPCLLRPPDPAVDRESKLFSDSSDSEEDEEEDATAYPSIPAHRKYRLPPAQHTSPPASPTNASSTSFRPPPLPPRKQPHFIAVSDHLQTNRMLHDRKGPVVDSFPIREEIFIDQSKQSDFLQSLKHQKSEAAIVQSLRHGKKPLPPTPPPHASTSRYIAKRKVPPPKPRRKWTYEGWEPDWEEDGGEDLTEGQREHIREVVRRVSGILDYDVRRLYKHMSDHPPSPDEQRLPSTPESSSLPRRLSRSAENLASDISQMPRSPVASRTSTPTAVAAAAVKISISPPLVNGTSRPKPQNRIPSQIASLIQRFEGRSEGPLSQRLSPPTPKKSLVRRTQSSNIISTSSQAPSPPPKPYFSPPSLPPRPLRSSAEECPPVVPPRTPAPLLPPKPPGSKSPKLPPRQRSSSEADLMPEEHEEGDEEEAAPFEEIPPTPPPKRGLQRYRYYKDGSPVVFPRRERGREDGVAQGNGEGEKGKELREMEDEETRLLGLSESAISSMTISQLPGSGKGDEPLENGGVGGGGAGGGGKSSGLKWKPPALAWAKKLKFPKKPRKRIKKFIIELAADTSQEFGKQVCEFISDMRNRNAEPHQKMLSEIRTFTTTMHNHLLEHHRAGLIGAGMESCNNFEHVVETSLQQCILQPLSHFVYLRIEEYFTQNGFLFQVQRSIYQGKNRSPEEMGIRKHLVLPNEKVVAEISLVFQRMMKTYCAISKLEFLLEAVRLAYESVRDSRQPKKPMTDLGADDFLPLFVWVLVQCSFHRAEIEAEYMWGLAHPSLFNGEAGYYLTTLTSAVNVLKELTQPPTSPTPEIPQLPAMNNLQTELKVLFEDEKTGKYSSAYYLPVVPTMSAAEICDIIAEKHRKANPEDYALFTIVNGMATMVEDEELPQEIKLRWTLDRNAQQSTGQPSSRFIAYRKKDPPAS